MGTPAAHGNVVLDTAGCALIQAINLPIDVKWLSDNGVISPDEKIFIASQNQN